MTADSCRDGMDAELRARSDALLRRANDLASSHLQGINEAAEELAEMTKGDLRVLFRARRLTLERLSHQSDATTHQVMSLIRRALELGDWPGQWSDTRHVP